MTVYPDSIEPVYTVKNLPQGLLHDPKSDSNRMLCRGETSYPNLQLPDGSILYPAAEKLFGKYQYAADGSTTGWYAAHLFHDGLPPDITELTLLLQCLEGTLPGIAPLDWQVPFKVIEL